MALRPQDPLPDWISHVARIEGRRVYAKKRDSASFVAMPGTEKSQLSSKSLSRQGKILVEMKDVNVRYHERHVCRFDLSRICVSGNLIETGLKKHKLDN